MRRAFTAILLLVEALFFNVVIPGHTRGMIQLPGSKLSAPCCAAKANRSNPSPCDENRTSQCAICNFAAHMSVPPVIDVAPKPTALINTCPVVQSPALVRAPILLTCYERAPPELV